LSVFLWNAKREKGISGHFSGKGKNNVSFLKYQVHFSGNNSTFQFDFSQKVKRKFHFSRAVLNFFLKKL